MEKVFIQIESNIDGETVMSTAEGEYRFKDGKHWIVYTGNVVTKNGIIADESQVVIQLEYSMSCRAAVNDAAVRIQVRKK